VILFELPDDLEEMVGILIEKRSPRDITLLAGEQIMENGFVGHDVRFGSEIEEHWMPLNDREMRLVWQGRKATAARPDYEKSVVFPCNFNRFESYWINAPIDSVSLGSSDIQFSACIEKRKCDPVWRQPSINGPPIFTAIN